MLIKTFIIDVAIAVVVDGLLRLESALSTKSLASLSPNPVISFTVLTKLSLADPLSVITTL